MKVEDPSIINICIVDDHPLVRAGIRRLIESTPQMIVSFEASDGSDFLNKIVDIEIPHIVILDVNMPGMNGFDLLSVLKKEYPSIKPIILSMVNGEDSYSHFLTKGALACVSKSSGMDTLIHVITTVFEKGIYTSNLNISRTLSKAKSFNPKTGYFGQSYLTPRESLILKYLASNSTYAEIAQQVSLEEKTIQNYRDRIYNKLGIKNRTDLTLFAIKNGLVNPFI
jgi:two-component system invasion response regulator UvrY